MPEKLTVAEIVANYLHENGFDGLAGDECGCDFKNLMNCNSEDVFNCVGGYKVPCDGSYCDGDCYWHITSEKPEKKFKN